MLGLIKSVQKWLCYTRNEDKKEVEKILS